MINIFKLSAFLLLSFNCAAQQQDIINIAKNCSQEDIKKNIYYLASPELKGRMMASHGDTLASKYVANWFKKNNVKAPYDNGKSYFQNISATKQTEDFSFAISKKMYGKLDGWQIYPDTPLSLKQIPILFTNYADCETLLHDLPKMNAKGKAIIISTPAFLKTFYTNIDSVEEVLKKEGVQLVIWSGPVVEKSIATRKFYDFLPEYVQNKVFDNGIANAMPELGLMKEKLEEIVKPDNITINPDYSFNNPRSSQFYDLKNTVTVEIKRKYTEVHAPNVIGVVEGTDTSLPCIIISAHHDHDGTNGKDIYYGAVDNASGTAVIMQLTTLLKEAASKGLRPKRTIVFASFTGEERGLLGSFYYADHPVYPIKKTYADFNIDMLGRVDTFYSGKRADSNYAYILVKDTAGTKLREDLYKANASFTNLKLDTYYENPRREKRRLQGSDQYPFYIKGVPFLRVDCGFCKDYHKPTDTPDKINYPLITRQTQLCFLTLWNIANE